MSRFSKILVMLATTMILAGSVGIISLSTLSRGSSNVTSAAPMVSDTGWINMTSDVKNANVAKGYSLHYRMVSNIEMIREVVPIVDIGSSSVGTSSHYGGNSVSITAYNATYASIMVTLNYSQPQFSSQSTTSSNAGATPAVNEGQNAVPYQEPPPGISGTYSEKSFWWGNAAIGVSYFTFLGSVGFNNLAAFLSFVSGVLIAAGAIALISSVAAAPVTAVVIGSLTLYSIYFLNNHLDQNGNAVFYALVGESTGHWWDPWDYGIYEEVGAYTNHYTNFWGQGFDQPWTYDPIFGDALPAIYDVAGNHEGIWPTPSPPW